MWGHSEPQNWVWSNFGIQLHSRCVFLVNSHKIDCSLIGGLRSVPYKVSGAYELSTQSHINLLMDFQDELDCIGGLVILASKTSRRRLKGTWAGLGQRPSEEIYNLVDELLAPTTASHTRSRSPP